MYSKAKVKVKSAFNILFDYTIPDASIKRSEINRRQIKIDKHTFKVKQASYVCKKRISL